METNFQDRDLSQRFQLKTLEYTGLPTFNFTNTSFSQTIVSSRQTIQRLTQTFRHQGSKVELDYDRDVNLTSIKSFASDRHSRQESTLKYTGLHGLRIFTSKGELLYEIASE